MYYFLLNDGNKVNEVLLDGYIVGDIILEDIFIHIHFNKHNQIVASFNKKDTEKLKGIDTLGYLKEACFLAKDYIEAKDFKYLLPSSNKNQIINIINEHNQSYYQENIHLNKKISHFKKDIVTLITQPICGKTILNNVIKTTTVKRS